jgi:hypothetical protein
VERLDQIKDAIKNVVLEYAHPNTTLAQLRRMQEKILELFEDSYKEHTLKEEKEEEQAARTCQTCRHFNWVTSQCKLDNLETRSYYGACDDYKEKCPPKHISCRSEFPNQALVQAVCL